MAELPSFVLEVKVVPQSGTQGFKLDKNGQLKCLLKGAPEKGKANKELVKFIASVLKIPQHYIQLISGQTTRLKRLRIFTDVSYKDFLQLIGVNDV
jgi:uncharacterized protein